MYFFKKMMVYIMVLSIVSIILFGVLQNNGIDVRCLVQNNCNETTKVDLLEAPFEPLYAINKEMRGKNIITRGFVKGFFVSRSGHAFFVIYDKSGKTLKGVMFKNEIQMLPARLDILKKYNETSTEIVFVGEVEIYKNELEIIVRKVSKEGK